MEDAVNFGRGGEFTSFDAFVSELHKFENQHHCVFSISSSVKLRACGISAEIRDKCKYKYIKYHCLFGDELRRRDGPRVRKTSSYKQKCKAIISGGFKMVDEEPVFRLITVNNEHNHPHTEAQFKGLPKQRRKTIDEASPYLKQVMNVQPNYMLLQNEVRKNSSTQGIIKRGDLRNFKAKHQSATAGITDLEQLVGELTKTAGAAVKVLHNQLNELEAVYFQDGKMKENFENYPDVVMFDGTYKLNDRRMPLIIVLSIDGESLSHIVGLFIVRSENAAALNFLFDNFKIENPSHNDIKVILTDKHFANRNAINRQFPNAAHHLCVFHVSQIFHREITASKRLVDKTQRAVCLRILHNMIYAKNQDEYNVYHQQLLDTNCDRKLSAFYFDLSQCQ